MRKIFTLAFTLVIIGSAVAQKNTVLVSGNVGFSSSKETYYFGDAKNTSVSVIPLVGYQFSNYLTAGVTGVYAKGRSRSNSSSADYKMYMAGAFLRYTKSLSPIFLVFGQVQGRVGETDNSAYYSGGPLSSQKGSVIDMGLYPGVLINLKNNLCLNFSFGGIGYGSTNIYGAYGGGGKQEFSVTFGRESGIGISKNF